MAETGALDSPAAAAAAPPDGSAASVGGAVALADPAGFQPDARCRPNYPKKEGSCHFFLTRKSRYCNIKAIEGGRWCGNHLPEDEQQQAQPTQQAQQSEGKGSKKKKKAKTRVPCPVDPSHTIYAHNLKGHVRVCTRRKENEQVAAQPFFRQDANSGAPSPETATTSSRNSSGSGKGPVAVVVDLPSLFASAQALAEACRARLFPSPAVDAVQQLAEGPAAEGIMAQIEANGWAHAQGRHVVQQASIVSHLHRRGLLDGETTAVELGAGRGSLGLAVKLAFPLAALVMVERSGVKFKSDKWLRKMETEGNANANASGNADAASASSSFRRLRMDLRHLYIQGLDLPAEGRLAFVGKHVCGVATDLSLRAVAIFLRERSAGASVSSSSSPPPPPAVGVGIACCCYHVCRWDDYVGKEVWEEEFGWGRAEFEVVQRCACWVSSCYGEMNNSGGSSSTKKEGASGEDQPPQQQHGDEAPEHTLPEEGAGGYGRGLSTEEKLAIGTACKRLVDYGRLEFLRRACGVGVEGEIVTYCEPSVSPENTCILAWTTAAAVKASE